MQVMPVVLESARVRLRPLVLSDHLALAAIGLDDEIWRWTPTAVTTVDEMRAYVEEALAAEARGTALPFAIVDPATDRILGSTRFGNIEPAHRRLEIGWTWLARTAQRTHVNTEAKLLLLRQAFDVLGCQRVELKTDSLNVRSRAAIRRLGAVEEGTLRYHMVVQGGRSRHTVYYSIVAPEWPAVRDNLAARCRRP